MKKSVLLATILVLIAISAPAFAEQSVMCVPTPPGCPTGSQVEIETWAIGADGKWAKFAPGAGNQLARAVKGTLTGSALSGNCNKQEWSVPLQTAAAVAQWCDWEITNNTWLWAVLKPGTYAADCIGFRVKSNGPITLKFTGFGDLTRQAPPAGFECTFPTVSGDTKTSIDTWYAFVKTTSLTQSVDLVNTTVSWTRANALQPIPLSDSTELHTNVFYKLFNKITVEDCNSSSYYANQGTISIALNPIVCFVNPTTGLWIDK